ncbi:MAG: GxxExxY protein [Planctomycetes bacterium]|nr:GxxExxY protein [Planctomycetota bacterium]
MPIHTAVPIRVFDQETYHQIDRRVTGIAFEIHNEFGRYLEERLYQRELTSRCRDTGMIVEPEVKITASFADFSKDYFTDHLVENGVILETKAASAFTQTHQGQLLNYLFLCGLHHGTLLNFRTERVQHQFVSTRLTTARRRQFDLDVTHWEPLSSSCRQLQDILSQLLTEWGAFLDPVLYRDACTHFLGGETRVCKDVAVHSQGKPIGTQKMHMLTEDIAFSITASTHRPETVFEHQHRFLEHTPLRALQWINLNHHSIDFKTITKSCDTK